MVKVTALASAENEALEDNVLTNGTQDQGGSAETEDSQAGSDAQGGGEGDEGEDAHLVTKKRTDKQIKKLLRDRRVAESLTEQVTAQSREKDAEIERLRARLNSTSKVAVDRSSEALKLAADSLVGQLKAARNAGDIDAQEELEEKLFNVRAELRDIDRAKAVGSEEGGEDQGAKPQPKPQQQAAPVISEETQDWLDANEDWFNIRDPSAGNKEAMELAIAMDPLLRKKGFEFGTKAYFEEVDRRLAAEMPDEFASKAKAEGGKIQGRSPVAGRSSGVGGADGGARVPNKKLTLSPREQDMARRLILNGGVLKRPVLIDLDGKGPKWQKLPETEESAFRVQLYEREKAGL